MNKFIKDLDHYCLQWTVIWYSTQQDDITKWPEDRGVRFDKLRVKVLQNLYTSLMKVTPK